MPAMADLESTHSSRLCHSNSCLGLEHPPEDRTVIAQLEYYPLISTCWKNLAHTL